VSSRLAGVDPAVATRVQRVLDAMAALGFPMMVVAGLRTVAEQQALYARGRTAPGRIVTYADGVTKPSHHQSGRAVDCVFLADGKPSWAEGHPWAAYGACAEAVGLVWGGRWRMRDLPHVELPEDRKAGVTV
jgi:peptidoglycan L-alanyl-D-glutamate endopeptidase CwlK